MMDEILDAWQRIEFFQPYSLEEGKKNIWITRKQLNGAGDKSLPWLSTDLRDEFKIPEENVLYNIYLGIFDKSVAGAISDKVLGKPSAEERHDAEQRLDSEGLTCFAKLPVSAHGTPSLDKLSISSLPWALGMLESNNLGHLSSAFFSADCELLKKELDGFSNTLSGKIENRPVVLTGQDILRLLDDVLVKWASFKPEWKFAFKIEWLEVKKTNNKNEQVKCNSETETDDGASIQDKQFIMPILNSFFYEDLERSRVALAKGDNCLALRSYLSEQPNKKVDLYTQQGLLNITEQLRPAKMPAGRWPSAPEHPMSLMQQFAINTAIEELADGGLLSVNGPPGTGKTTLLRDLIAHNIVARAKVLASFECVTQTTDDKGFIVNKLTGFEMLVASSNNAAVENISKELPQKSSVADAFRHLNYLAEVANQTAAERRPVREIKTKGVFLPLEEAKQCWGMVSAALGKKANRSKFVQRFFFDKHYPKDFEGEKLTSDSTAFLNFLQWHKKNTQRTSFAKARQAFLSHLQQVESLQRELSEYDSLLAAENQTKSAVQQLESDYQEQMKRLAELNVQQQQLEVQCQAAEQQEILINNREPGWFSKLLNRKRTQAFLLEQKSACDAVAKVKNQQEELVIQKTERQLCVLKLDEQCQQIHKDNEALRHYRQKFSGMALPDSAQAINDKSLQRKAFWQSEIINRQRSELFIAAMELHQAWLCEAIDKCIFGSNITGLHNFLKHPYKQDVPLRWWQLFFMIVPVISTTFASVGRMLQGVESEALGWLMIDEAGQAPPQQAVGAIRRCKRTLVVGDPLQIEPVFTTSPRLVEHLCKDKLGEVKAKEWSPAHRSVQQIADRANAWGTQLHVMGASVWIGIPLWVHRRCREPMFSLANNMAYNGRMIHGTDDEKIMAQPISKGPGNHWLISSGGEADRQYRDSHGKGLIVLLNQLMSAQVELESIYVITPFKAVKQQLAEALKSWEYPELKVKQRNRWIEKSIGTVHTFQGKENKIVILVLGCDEQDCGGAQWAASKPNILNVALTRAKENVFVVGDPAVWGDLSWFRDVAAILPLNNA